MNGSPDLNPFLYGFQVGLEGYIGLDSKFLRCSRVSICDEVVHDQVVDVTELNVSKLRSSTEANEAKGMCDGDSDRQVKCFLLNVFQRDSQLELSASCHSGREGEDARGDMGVKGDK